MPADGPPDRAAPITITTALRLHDALSELDIAVERLTRHQTKANAQAKQIDTLAQALQRQWTAAAHGNLLAATARYGTASKAAQKAQTAVTRARRAYDKALQAYSDSFDRQAAHQADLRAALDRRHRQNAALVRTVQALFDNRWQAELRAYEAEGDEAVFDLPKGSHDYIPIDIPRFLDLLTHLDRYLAADPVYADGGTDRYRPVSFLEIGCGSGRNTILARACGLCRLDTATGFDINPVTVEIGRRTFGLGEDLQIGDALDHDYGAYDVIYSFRPFCDLDLQARLEERIAATMHPGAYLLAPLSLDLGLYPDLEPAGNAPDIWRKSG